MKPRIADGLRRAYQALSARMGDDKLSIPQITVLRSLPDSGTIYQRQITDKTGIDRSTLSELLRRMQEKGLVVNVTNGEDKRAVSVSMTTRGRAALIRADGALADAESAIMKRIPVEDRPAFLRAIKAISENV